ncbi:MAG: DNA replication/repair protein RecF [Elusimicrobiota bacterium]
MLLQSLILRQFRNHENLELDVDSGVNLFIGSNGAGKTNLLEAIGILSTGISPRGAETESMVMWSKDGFSVKGTFVSDDQAQDPLTLEMKYRTGSARIIRQDEKKAVRLRDLLGKVPLVSFVPEDLSLVKGEPDLRRRAVNMILSQVDPSYAENLKAYADAVKERNAALRQCAEGLLDSSLLEPWDMIVAKRGLYLCQKRSDFLNEFSECVSLIQQHLSKGKEKIKLEYKPSFQAPWGETDLERWCEQFKRIRPQELATGSTMLGPHRDDFLFLINDRPARLYASEGQKRTCAVSFKLAEIPFIEERCGQKPICLLDDVLSEFDAERAEQLLYELSQTGQCFVTLTGFEAWPEGCKRPASIFQVNEYGVKRLTNSEHASTFEPMTTEVVF